MGRGLIWAAGLLVAAFLLAPILAILPLSFSAGSFLFYPLPGVSLRWYRDFFGSDFWLPALWNSLLIGERGGGAGHACSACRRPSGCGGCAVRRGRWCWGWCWRRWWCR